MDRQRLRNLIPAVYAILTVIAFLVSSTIGVIVLIVGAMVSGALWSSFGGGENAAAGGNRAEARAARRSRRR